MKNKQTPYLLLSAALILALVTLACNAVTVSSVNKIKTGPTQEVEVHVPIPPESTAGAELNLEFIAGNLKLAPGSDSFLASGTATFNVVGFEPIIETAGSSSTIHMSDQEIKGFPVAEDEFKNEWDLQLASTPMSLSIHAGGYSGSFELGGLSLKKLAISEGGSDVTCAFSSPNQVEMSSFTYTTGGSRLVLKGLSNANFAQMAFSAGAGDYTLSFDDDLRRDASVTIDSGAGTVNLIIPDGVNARVTFEGGLTTVNPSGGWVQNDKVYTLSGSGPSLTITIKMGLGTLNLKTE